MARPFHNRPFAISTLRGLVNLRALDDGNRWEVALMSYDPANLPEDPDLAAEIILNATETPLTLEFRLDQPNGEWSLRSTVTGAMIGGPYPRLHVAALALSKLSLLDWIVVAPKDEVEA